MAILKILQYPNPALKEVSHEVIDIDDTVRREIRDLVDTMRASPGVALAAPQLGILKRIIAVDVTPKSKGYGLIVLVDPVIVSSTGTKTVREGCLSIPEYTANIKRAEEVSIKGFDADGLDLTIQSSGFEAVALQHEIDHLDGILFIDRIESIKSLFKRKVKRPE